MKIHNQVRIEGPLEFVSVTELEFRQVAGDHGWLEIRGAIKENMEETGIHMDADSNIDVYVSEEERLLFSGIPVSIKLEHGEKPEVVLKAASRTILMDIEKKNRSFQYKTMNYSKLIEEIVRENDGDFLIQEEKEDCIPAPLIQYRETNWQFLKRLASCYGCHLFASAAGKKPQVCLGTRAGEKKEEVKTPWQIKKQVEEYLRFRKMADGMESDFLQCEVTSNVSCQIGDIIRCSDIDFQVAGICGKFKNGGFQYTYQLVREGGLPIAECRNPYVKGCSFTGTVLAAGRNQVKIHLDMDKNQEEGDAYWYPIHRTDWYCMPEEGSTAFLCIPGDDEKEAYVTGIQRRDGEENKKAQKPQNKYMGTAEGKELKFAPGSVSLHAAENRIRIELSEGRGIRIKSRKGIRLDAGGVWKCHGKTVRIESEERVVLHTDRTAIVLDDMIQVKG